MTVGGTRYGATCLVFLLCCSGGTEPSSQDNDRDWGKELFDAGQIETVDPGPTEFDSVLTDESGIEDVTVDYGQIDVYTDLFQAVYQHFMAEVSEEGQHYAGGDLLNDFGDGTAYAPAFLFARMEEGIATELEEKVAGEIVERSVGLIDEFNEKGLITYLAEAIQNPSVLTEIYMSVAGMYMAYHATGNGQYLDTIHEYFETMAEVVDPDDTALLDSLLETPVPPYGATTIIGGLAGFYLQYPFSVGAGPQADKLAETGTVLLDRLDDAVFDDTRNNYRYINDAEYTFIYQYSNLTTLQGLVRAHIHTGQQTWLDRAMTIMETLEVLWDEEYQGYMAAENDPKYFELYDAVNNPKYKKRYIPLSGANYQVYANLLMYQVTEEEKYHDRIKKILDFIRDSLFHDGIAWHDIQDGKLTGSYCSGCNFQLLYNIYLYDRLLKGKSVL